MSVSASASVLALLGSLVFASSGVGWTSSSAGSSARVEGWFWGCVETLRSRALAAPRPPGPPGVTSRDPWSVLAPNAFEVVLADRADLGRELVARCSAEVARPGFSADPRAWPEPAVLPAPADALAAWIDGCRAEILALAGHDRAAVGRVMTLDGGISWAGEGRFVHRRCQTVKARIEFRYAADAEGRANLSDRDPVAAIAVYIGLGNPD